MVIIGLGETRVAEFCDLVGNIHVDANFLIEVLKDCTSVNHMIDVLFDEDQYASEESVSETRDDLLMLLSWDCIGVLRQYPELELVDIGISVDPWRLTIKLQR